MFPPEPWKKYSLLLTSPSFTRLATSKLFSGHVRALPALSNKKFQLGPGKHWQQLKGKGLCSCCVRPLLSQWGTAAFFSLRIPRSLSCEFPNGKFQTCGALSIPYVEPRRKPPTFRTPYIF
ncbi:hypothetical protein H5410_046273 [Solanum commersonii]|uniref:Uncharacterized protein n=1 Tax=Solanum commersonii TaxID=4109 RepID=A0A9J5XDZ8_SOLCO|nr:hypothetical protein H5410_046273 [Solanum commersonii]